MENKIYKTSLVPTENADYIKQLWLDYKGKLHCRYTGYAERQIEGVKPQILVVLSDEETINGDIDYFKNGDISGLYKVENNKHTKAMTRLKVIASASKELTPDAYIESVPDWWIEKYNSLGACSGVELNDFSKYKDTAESLKFATGKVALLQPKEEQSESPERKAIFTFIAEIKREFKDENWDYLDFIAERVLKTIKQ